MVTWAWWIVYREIPRLHEWCAIITHDWGYWGCPNMDGKEGEAHPERSARLWKRYFRSNFGYDLWAEIMGHSRFNAAKHDMRLSKLFQADKLSMALYPKWLYLLLGNLSGEIHEYMDHAKNGRNGKYSDIPKAAKTQVQWLIETQAHMALMGFHGENYAPVARQMKGETS